MRALHQIFLILSILILHGSSAYAHDDLVAKEKEFRYGYQIGYIAAIRESHEGSMMCTKGVSLLEVIKTIGAYNKAMGSPSDQAYSAKNITEALSAKYKCNAK